MPNFKKHTFYHENSAGARMDLVVDVKIDAAGVFYGNLPDYLADAFAGEFAYSARTPAGRFRIEATTFDAFCTKVYRGLKRFMEPEVTKEHVIQYNIESHVSFATDDHGNIYPNAGFPGAKWARAVDDRMFGGHHAANPSRNGYSLTIGARAMTKVTTTYGEKKKVSYERYYKGGSNHGHDNPAELLNSWCSLGVGEDPKEIPYTDEAAMFFHRLLLGMATLNRQIQEATFNQNRLLALIEKQAGVPMLGFGGGSAVSESLRQEGIGH